jgi:protein-S-isoprenylcysteine O-methyltransferase Ste14
LSVKNAVFLISTPAAGLILVTFCLVVLTYFVIQIQIRLEEEFLEKQHKTDYINYKFKTRRLI